MPKKKLLKWPTGYIEDAPDALDRESFERKVRLHRGLSKEALALFRGEESKRLFTRLFQIARVFLRNASGIESMKKARIHGKLASFVKAIEQDWQQSPSGIDRQLKKWSDSGHPWESDYARSFLSQTRTKEAFTKDWLRENRFQLILASTRNRKSLKQEFTEKMVIYLRPRLQEKTTRNGRSLGKKKQWAYMNALIGAVMLAAGETWASCNEIQERARLSQQKSRSLIQQRPGREHMGEEEINQYVQIGRRYMRMAGQKSQNS